MLIKGCLTYRFFLNKDLILYIGLSLLFIFLSIKIIYPLENKRTGDKIPLQSLQSNMLIIEGSKDHYKLGTYLEILEDKNRTLSINDIRADEIKNSFKKSDVDIPLFGFSESAYWVRFTIAVKESSYAKWKLELACPHIDYIDLYIPQPDNSYHKISSGYLCKVSDDMDKLITFAFDIDLAKDTMHTFYIRIVNNNRIEIPLIVWSNRAFFEKVQNIMLLYGLYFGLISVVVILNLILFISVRDVLYINYVIFALLMGIFQLSLNGFAYKYLSLNKFLDYNHYDIILIGLLSFFGIQFSQSFLDLKKNVPRINVILTFLKYFFTICCFILPLFVNYSLANKISYIGVTPQMVFLYVSGIIMIIKKYPPAKYYVFAWGILIFFAGFYILKTLGVIGSNFFTTNSFIIGSSIELVVLTIGLGEKINLMRVEKERAQEDVINAQKIMVENLMKSYNIVKEANRKISLSEKRYKILVEGSSDIIFSMDKDWNILTVNQAIKEHFNVRPEDIYSKKFHDLLFGNLQIVPETKGFLLEKLDAFLQNKESIQFRADFKTSINDEPKEMTVKLEYLEKSDGVEILGKATPVTEDMLMKNIEYEKQILFIGNYLIQADDLSHRATRNLLKYMESGDVKLIQVGLREVIINAIEHGNLGISFEEKSEAITKNNYFNFIKSRQYHPEYKNKKVTVEYVIDTEKVVYKIKDQGNGFNHRFIISNILDKVSNNLLSHGRGIAIAMSIFDVMKYNDKGNEVILKKYFNSDICERMNRFG